MFKSLVFIDINSVTSNRPNCLSILMAPGGAMVAGESCCERPVTG